MSYRNIRDIVSQSFEQTRDLRIENTIEQNGASHLLSAVYNAQDAEDRKFYRKPKLAEGEETKLAILYGETMITPYIIDVGVGNGVNDPSNITRTIRFIAGDGETEGVVIGPNGSLLENVYLGSEGEQAQPVIDDDGRPSTKDILIGAALGGLVQSIPSIWDAITDDAPEADKVGESDPITGEKILTKDERKKLENITSSTNIEDLANVDGVVESGTDYILVFDNCTQQWIPKPINDIVNGAITVQPGTDGTAATAGTAGIAGLPATPATAEFTTDPEELVMPNTDLQKDPGVQSQSNTLGSMEELVDIATTANNQYKETRDCSFSKGIILNFLYEGMGIYEEWKESNKTDPSSTFSCLESDAPSNPGTVKEFVGGTVKINVCLSVVICGSEFAFYENVFEVSEHSRTDFTKNLEILWEGTDIETLLGAYNNQISSNVTIRLRRIDGIDGAPTSIFPAHYQGIKILKDDLGWAQPTEGYSDVYPGIGSDEVHVLDDSVYPDSPPNTSGLGVEDCPSRQGTTIPASAGSAAIPAVAPTAGTAGTAGQAPIVSGTPPLAVPKIVIGKPFSTVYCPDEDASNAPNFYDKSDLARITSVTSGIVATNVVVTWTMVKGKGLFVIEPGMPVSIAATLATNLQTVTLDGPADDMIIASTLMKIQAADDATGEINYKITLQNDEGSCAGMLLKVMPCSAEVLASNSACAEIKLTGDTTDTGTTRVFTTLPNSTTSDDEKTQELTSTAIAKTNGQTLDAYATAVAANMQNNINAKNALGSDHIDFLPAYIVTTIGPVIKVCAPAGGGDKFNGTELTMEQTGDVSTNFLDSILNFFGGATRNVFNTPSNEAGGIWSIIGDTLLGIGGNIAGMALANMLFNDSSTLSISLPESDKDVSVAFLYRGRKVKMPDAYDPATRTGTPTYSGWAGDWTNSTLTKVAWTDNPAYCLLDYIENRKFGLGDDLELSVEQKNQLVSDIFEIATYCDEIVDGEARFSLNTAITDGTKIQILEQLCSVFFGSFVFYKGGLRIRADKPDANIKLLVNQTNAGDFTYEHATLKSFINKVVVTYVDPNSFYIEKTVTAENQQGISKYGEKAAQVFGFGITSETQALRYANWILQSEIENSLTVSYQGGWDHYRLIPGDIVQFEDSNERGSRLAGRATVSGSNVALDGDCVAVVGDAFSITEDDGTVHETTIASVTDASNIVLNAAPSGAVVNNSTFTIADQSIGKQLFRVVKVDETSDGVFNTTLQLYNADKYNKIIAATRS